MKTPVKAYNSKRHYFLTKVISVTTVSRRFGTELTVAQLYSESPPYYQEYFSH